MHLSFYNWMAVGVLTLAAAIILAVPAEAGPQHHHRQHHHQIAKSDCFIFCLDAAPARQVSFKASHRPARWCGWYMAKHFGITGKLARSLWVARNWARVGSPAHGPQVGAIVVWRHHVGKITAVRGRHIRVLSGNDGHAVRDRWRTTAGVIAYRWPPPGSWASL